MSLQLKVVIQEHLILAFNGKKNFLLSFWRPRIYKAIVAFSGNLPAMFFITVLLYALFVIKAVHLIKVFGLFNSMDCISGLDLLCFFNLMRWNIMCLRTFPIRLVLFDNR